MANYTKLTNLEVTGNIKSATSTVAGNSTIGGALEVTGAIVTPSVTKVIALGSVAFGTASIDTGVALTGTIPAGYTLVRVMCNVTTVFNAGDTNVLTLGVTDALDSYMAAGDITEGTVGVYAKDLMVTAGTTAITFKAQYTQTGTAASTGAATFYAIIAKLA